jgi:probable phosphoglycerate mutase
MRTLLLVRHGETVWNREGRFQGHVDIPLNEQGRAQARALRVRLEADHAYLFDDARSAVVTSDLCRAHETAAIVFGGGGRALHVRPALREFCYGVFEGLTREEIDARYPDAMAAWLRGDRAFAIEGGESRDAVHARVHAAVGALLAETAQPNVVIVAHGGVMRQLMVPCFPRQREPWPLSFENTVVHAIRVESHGWSYAGRL